MGCNTSVGSNPTASAEKVEGNMNLKTLKPFYKADEIKVPGLNADWDELMEFALSFNGYEYAGGMVELAGNEECLWDRAINAMNVGNKDRVSVDDLRACMFWEQRGARYHSQLEGDAAYDIENFRWFVKEIREKLGI